MGAFPLPRKPVALTLLPFLINIVNTGPSRNRRRRLHYPADDSPIKLISDHIAPSFAQDKASVLKTYKAPYTLCPLYREEESLTFLYINAAIRLYRRPCVDTTT